VAFRAAPDRPVGVRPADLVAAQTPRLGRGRAFQAGEGIGRPIDRAGMVPLSERDQLRRHAVRAADGGPGRQGMPAARELVVLRAVAALTVARGDVPRQAEVEVVVRLLPVLRLVAVVAGDVGAAVLAALELVDDGRGLLRWHWAHRPVARTSSGRGCRVSDAGRALLTSRAASTSPLLRVTAMKTDRKGIFFVAAGTSGLHSYHSSATRRRRALRGRPSADAARILAAGPAP
jgi:hypothetical protein